MTNTDTRPDIYDRALAFAELHHANDYRKDGKTPYMVHVHAVVENARKIVLAESPAARTVSDSSRNHGRCGSA